MQIFYNAQTTHWLSAAINSSPCRGGVGPPLEYIANQQFLYSAIHLPLTCCLVFFLLSSLLYFLTQKVPKTSALGNSSQPLFCSRVASDIFQSKRSCRLNFLFDFWVLRDSLCYPLASNRVTSGQTLLALFPKIKQVQAVEFNGAG